MQYRYRQNNDLLAGRPVALWMIGPVGSGKSTRLSGLRGYAVVDQDVELERLLNLSGLPLDTRQYNSDQARRFAELRAEAAAQTWNLVPGLRQQGRPMAFETSGDKPWLLAEQILLNQQAGYDNWGVGVCCPLANCLIQNQQRPRVLSEAVVISTWRAFDHHLAIGTYQAIFGEGRFICLGPDDTMDLEAWIRTT